MVLLFVLATTVLKVVALPPSEERQAGHSEGIVRTSLARLESWIAAVAAALASMLFVAAIILLIVILLAVALAARRRWRDDHREAVDAAPESLDPVAIARWVEEGRQLFNLWQERVERLEELQGSSRWWIFAALMLAACASPPLYTESTPPTVMTTSTAAGVLDMRGTYREALCRRLAGSAYSCDGVLRRLAGESAPDPAFASVPMSDLAGRYRVGFVPGFMAECVKGIITPFADVLTALRAAGIDARILDVGGRGSTAENAERLALDITASADDARPFVIVAYSKGLPDVLELLVTRQAAAARVAAVVSVAGASNGSPLADRFRTAYDLLVAKFPLAGCRPGTGQALDDLRRDVRLEWWRRHAAAVSVPIFTLVTAPRRERVSPLMRPAYLTLARLEPRNDGNLLWYDQIPPGSRLLGYLDADHWGVATPYSEQIPIAGPFFADSVPRPSIIEAALEVVSTSLQSGAW